MTEEQLVEAELRERVKDLGNIRELVELYIRSSDLKDKNFKWDLRAFQYPLILSKSSKYWDTELEKPNLEKLEHIRENYSQFVDRKTIQEQWDRFREERNQLLKQSDWTQIADVPMNTEERTTWRQYRNYLRSSTTLYNNDAILTAKPLNFEQFIEFKEGKRSL